MNPVSSSTGTQNETTGTKRTHLTPSCEHKLILLNNY